MFSGPIKLPRTQAQVSLPLATEPRISGLFARSEERISVKMNDGSLHVIDVQSVPIVVPVIVLWGCGKGRKAPATETTAKAE